uniref:Uncharacterized protein AlNc14C443G11690 n=1 Tax=Albugo laibachii Nc14 TaxID=890382 RepID=F0WZU9_9STRA|nr:hypothetical protein AN8717.2 [Albugo laibachii Nc14]|eukprot:CCA27026.1 hypothetical protein AN8717.2 [Albugo laibachii Nc14]
MAWFQMQQWVQEQLGVTLRRSTAQRIKNIDAKVFMSINPLRKKSRSVKFPLLEKALIELILAKPDVICRSDDLILEKSLRLREQLKINECELQRSNGWLSKFKERNSIKSRTLHGESGSVCEAVLKASQTQIQSLIAKFSPDDVFKLDETALYYRLPPNKTLAPIQIQKAFLRWCLELVESNTVRKLTLLEDIEFSIESWRSVSEQVIRNCWVKTGLIDAIINAKFQSNNDYRLNSIPFQQ